MHEIKNVKRKIAESQDFLGKKHDAQQKKIHDLIEDYKYIKHQVHAEHNDLVGK